MCSRYLNINKQNSFSYDSSKAAKYNIIQTFFIAPYKCKNKQKKETEYKRRPYCWIANSSSQHQGDSKDKNSNKQRTHQMLPEYISTNTCMYLFELKYVLYLI